MDRDELLQQVRALLAKAFGRRLRGVVLYGSEARGDAAPDSDIDLLVLLADPLREPADSHLCIDALYPLVLGLGRPIHAEPVGVTAYEEGKYPLYRHARQEGIMA